MARIRGILVWRILKSPQILVRNSFIGILQMLMSKGEFGAFQGLFQRFYYCKLQCLLRFSLSNGEFSEIMSNKNLEHPKRVNFS